MIQLIDYPHPTLGLSKSYSFKKDVLMVSTGSSVEKWHIRSTQGRSPYVIDANPTRMVKIDTRAPTWINYVIVRHNCFHGN